MNDTVLEDETRFFWVRGGSQVRSIRQLIEVLPEISEEDYAFHMNAARQDFSNWIKDVFAEEELAELVRPCRTKEEFLEKVYTYLMKEKQREKGKVEATFTEAQKEVFAKDPTRFVQVNAQESQREERVSEESDETRRRIEEKKKESILPATITRLDALKVREKELQEYLSLTRKEGRDVIFPTLVLRQFKPKAVYATKTQRTEDFDKVEEILNRVEKELLDVVMAPLTDVKKEVELLVQVAERADQRAEKKGVAMAGLTTVNDASTTPTIVKKTPTTSSAGERATTTSETTQNTTAPVNNATQTTNTTTGTSTT